MGRDGFEPSKSVTTDLQSAPFGHSGTSPYLLELAIGIEPTTCWLQISCSAYWATPAYYVSSYFCFLWCLGAESNHRHGDFQSPALPTELPRQKKWRPGTGSNRRPPAWQAGVLTNWTTGPWPFFNFYSLNYVFWWAFRDSNPGPIGYEPTALTSWAKSPNKWWRLRDSNPCYRRERAMS